MNGLELYIQMNWALSSVSLYELHSTFALDIIVETMFDSELMFLVGRLGHLLE